MEIAYKTIIEPFKIKTVEPLGFTTRHEREELLKKAGCNLFSVPADKVLIDLLTDSGTSAMSSEQWAGIMRGDESYAGARSFFHFEKTVRDLTGYRTVIPVHQGRAAERILFSVVGGPGRVVLSNTHFDTTRANVEASGAEAVDLPTAEGLEFDKPAPFKGNMDVEALERKIGEVRPGLIPMVIMTVTNNSLGGHPVSMENLKAVRKVCQKHGIPLFLDAARFAENAHLIRLREPGYAHKSAREIAREMFALADGCLMSAKKDGLVNMGGFLAMNDQAWAAKAKEVTILGEGFPTYGGLAGRDLEALAQGLEEVLEEPYLTYRLRSVEYLGDGLRKAGVPIVEPPGGHAVYIDVKRLFPQIPAHRFPAQALACEAYLEGGVRTVEIGSLMFGKGEPDNGDFKPARMEFLRLAVPRRVYTQSHIDYVIEVFARVAARRKSVRGLRLVKAPAVLRHFTAQLAWAE